MKVVLSIKPEFANLIFDGKKGYEFRKVVFKNRDVKTVIVYSSSPVQRVIGEFDIDDILSMNPDELWRKTKSAAGIKRSFFSAYFKDRKVGFAIKIGKVRRYSIPKDLRSSFGITPPQSFAYVKE